MINGQYNLSNLCNRDNLSISRNKANSQCITPSLIRLQNNGAAQLPSPRLSFFRAAPIFENLILAERRVGNADEVS